jgi:hypothetical protein
MGKWAMVAGIPNAEKIAVLFIVRKVKTLLPLRAR